MKAVKILLAATVSGSLMLSGCTLDPYTGEKKASNTAKVGVGAAAVCALIGSRKDREHALKYAAICGAVGAGVGYYMDAQEAKLREKLEGSGVRVQRNGDQIKLIMPGNITFDSGKADLKTSFFPTLNSVADVVKEFKDTELAVSGHTDNTGSDERNRELSQQRAQSVQQFLRTNGISGARMSARGYGSSMPVGDNKTDAGRAANRRVELDLVPKAE